MNLNDIFDLSRYSEGYQFTIDNPGTTIEDLGNGKYKVVEIPKPQPTDSEIVATRAALYSSTSDPMFASYEQGGGTTLQSAINAKAQIQFDNKKSNQLSMTLDDFIHKITREYALSKSRQVSQADLTYNYQESSGSDDIVVTTDTLSLIRPTTGVIVDLPRIGKVQLVKIDNVSDDTVQIKAADGDKLDGVSGVYRLPSKSAIEFISSTTSLNWDVYVAPLEIEPIGIEVEDLFGKRLASVKKLIIGKNLSLTKVDDSTVKIEVYEG